MADWCVQSTIVKHEHCLDQLFDNWPPMVQKKIKKEKVLKSWKFKFKPVKENIKQRYNQVFCVSDSCIDMLTVHHEEMLHDHIREVFKSWSRRLPLCVLFRPNSQKILRGNNLERKMQKLKCPKSWKFKFKYWDLRGYEQNQRRQYMVPLLVLLHMLLISWLESMWIRNSRVELRSNRLWDPGGFLVEDETEITWSSCMIGCNNIFFSKFNHVGMVVWGGRI
ncbi:unnamed protein product [Arabidopsis thaliana]|uniref:Uncharacterized protein n=2 Tax=Arabidopsis thaliana TaxID=3702 RepID=A0A5S9WIW6_ARATH|nr:unnamed protein product [Arabidopsis thaliana]